MQSFARFFTFLFIVLFSGSAFASVTCDPGTYLSANQSECSTCTAGNYCLGGTFETSASDQGLTVCPTGYDDGGTGLTAQNECKFQTTPGYWIGTVNSSTEIICSSKYYCPSTLVNYGSNGSRIYCPTNYDDGGTGLSAIEQCKFLTYSGYYILNANDTAQTVCPSGYYCPSVYVSYGQTGDKIQCPEGYRAGSTGYSSENMCRLQTTAGYYIDTAYSTTQVICPVGYYCAAALVQYGSLGSISACPTGYIDGSTGAKTRNDCQILTTAGVNYSNLNQTVCPAGWYCPVMLLNYGSSSSLGCLGQTYSEAGASECTPCPTNYDDNGANYKTSVTACRLRTTNGTYVANAYDTTTTPCPPGYVCPYGYINYGSTGNIEQCTGATYLPGGATTASCYPCPSPYTYDTTDGKSSISQCVAQTNDGTYIKTSGGALTTCPAGSFCPSVLVNHGSLGSITQCTGTTYSEAGAASCTDCPSGYNYDTSDGKTSVSKCILNCPVGTRILSSDIGTSNCSSPSGNWFNSSTALVPYGSVSLVSYCANGFTSSGNTPSDHDALSDCKMSLPGGTYLPATTVQANYIKITGNGNTTDSDNKVVELQAFTSTDGTGTNYLAYSSVVTGTNATYAINGSWLKSYYSSCETGTGCVWNLGSVKTIGSFKIAMHTDGSTYHDVSIYTSLDGVAWTQVIGPIEITTQNIEPAVGEFVLISAPFESCTSGTFSTEQIISQGTTTTCTDCITGSYSDVGADSCIACQDGTTTSADGQSSCDTLCPNNTGDPTTTWDVATWINNTVNNICTTIGCGGGYYMDGLECSPVGIGYWSANGSNSRTACDTGLTTIGYGLGADESGDCGRILHFGNDKIYLRSDKVTTPSLNINISGKTFYGNMTTDTKGSLRITSGGTKYSVYDDSM